MDNDSCSKPLKHYMIVREDKVRILVNTEGQIDQSCI